MPLNKRKKILHVTQWLDIGGLETMIIELCRRLDRERFDVEILCLNGYDPNYIQVLVDQGIPVHLLKKRHRYDLGFFFRVGRFMRERRVEVLHAHSGCFFYAALFSLLTGVRRFLYTAHGLPVLEGLRDRIEDNLAALVADCIVPVSVEIGEVLGRRIPFARHKLHLIVNGIDTERFRPRPELRHSPEAARYGLVPDIFWIGSVGRLEPVKNYPMLLRAFARLEDTPGRRAGLVLVGEGSQMEALRELAANLGVAEKVVFLGMQYHVHEILPLLDVFVLSSLTEGTSISLLEAQACGVPAVVTDVGGNGFVIRHGENGLLCPLGSIEAMGEALCQLRDEPETVRAMARASRQRVQEGLDLHSMVENYQLLYQGND